MNYLDDKKNMMAILVVIGVLTAAAIGMLLSVPSVLRSNAANLAGHTNNSTYDSNVINPIG